MRKIIATEFYTLDGLMSDPKDQMDWVSDNFDPELGKYEDDLYGQADTLLLGRVTYKIFESFWPDAAKNPETPEGDKAMAQVINKITKIVFSKTLSKVEWENSKLVKDIDPEKILNMKQEQGKSMLLVGSASIVQQMTNLGLIDEFHFVVHPVILGTGKPLFKEIKERHNLNFLDTKKYKNGVVLLTYQSERKNSK